MGMSGCTFICCPIDSLRSLPGLNSIPRAVSWKIYNFLVQITWPCTQASRNCIMILIDSWKHLYLFITEISNSIKSARVLWSKPQAACITTRTCCEAFFLFLSFFSETHSSLTVFWASKYKGQNSNSKSAVFCL